MRHTGRALTEDAVRDASGEGWAGCLRGRATEGCEPFGRRTGTVVAGAPAPGHPLGAVEGRIPPASVTGLRGHRIVQRDLDVPAGDGAPSPPCPVPLPRLEPGSSTGRATSSPPAETGDPDSTAGTRAAYNLARQLTSPPASGTTWYRLRGVREVSDTLRSGGGPDLAGPGVPAHHAPRNASPGPPVELSDDVARVRVRVDVAPPGPATVSGRITAAGGRCAFRPRRSPVKTA